MPKSFADLPPEEQTRVRSATAQLSLLAQSFANFLFIGEGRDTHPTWNLASCFGLRFRQRPLLVTAAHVYAKYIERKEADQSTFAQAGNLALRLEDRVLVNDGSLDIAIFDLKGADLGLLRSDLYECDSLVPPRKIDVGDFVQFCGYPAYYKEQVAPREGSLAALAGFVEVCGSEEGRVYCYRDRDYMIEFGPGELPPASEVLGGLSGGPVLFRAPLHYPVVGLVSEFMPSFDTFKCAVFTKEIEAQCVAA